MIRTFPSIAAIAIVTAACGEPTSPRAGEPIVIAHRGASFVAPEHTIPAYEFAVAQGADFIEQDIARTKDGILVVIHDPTLDRTARGPVADCTGAVGDKTLEQLKRCDFGSWFNEAYPQRASPSFVGLRIQTLDETIGRFVGRAGFYIEIKNPERYPGIEQDLVTLIRSYPFHFAGGPDTQVFVQSFSAESLERLHVVDRAIPLVQLLGDEEFTDIASQLVAIRRYAMGIAPRSNRVNHSLLVFAETECLLVHPYGAESDEEVQSLLRGKVAGLFTDRPEALRASVRGHETSPAGRGSC